MSRIKATSSISIVSTLLTLIAGFVSWHLVEKRALRLKHLTWEQGRLRRRPSATPHD